MAALAPPTWKGELRLVNSTRSSCTRAPARRKGKDCVEKRRPAAPPERPAGCALALSARRSPRVHPRPPPLPTRRAPWSGRSLNTVHANLERIPLPIIVRSQTTPWLQRTTSQPLLRARVLQQRGELRPLLHCRSHLGGAIGLGKGGFAAKGRARHEDPYRDDECSVATQVLVARTGESNYRRDRRHKPPVTTPHHTRRAPHHHHRIAPGTRLDPQHKTPYSFPGYNGRCHSHEYISS